MNENLTKWHITNAGLVIVHPFISQLFNLLNYLDEVNKFKNNKSKQRAVHLLHFIATGQDKNIKEAELSISKILCGMQVKNSVPTDLVLTEKEKEMAIELLNVVILKWEKLGRTSPEGLRNTFLIRTGLLEFKDSAYQLTIESSGTDILLDFIPWNINIIKLPWMDQLLFTSWR